MSNFMNIILLNYSFLCTAFTWYVVLHEYFKGKCLDPPRLFSMTELTWIFRIKRRGDIGGFSSIIVWATVIVSGNLAVFCLDFMLTSSSVTESIRWKLSVNYEKILKDYFSLFLKIIGCSNPKLYIQSYTYILIFQKVTYVCYFNNIYSTFYQLWISF